MKEEIERLKDEEKEKLYPEPIVITEEEVNSTSKKRNREKSEQARRERLASERGFEFETAPSSEENRFGWVSWILLGVVATTLISALIAVKIPFWSLFLLIPGLSKLNNSWKTRQSSGEFDRKTRHEWNSGIGLFLLGLFFSLGSALHLPFLAFLIVLLGAIAISDRQL